MFLDITPTASLIFASFMSFLFLLVVCFEVYRVVFKKQDRMFWSGVYIMLLLSFTGYNAYGSWDLYAKSLFVHQKDAVTFGTINKDSLDIFLKGNKNSVGHSCEIDNSVDSNRCVFIMAVRSSSDTFVDVVYTKDSTILRFGHWPFAKEMAFPLIKM